MRPRKRLLLIDPRELRRSVTRFVLWNWRYRIDAVGTTKQAAAMLADPANDYRAVIGYAPLPEANFVMAACNRRVPSLLICPREDAKVRELADRTLYAPSMAETLETLAAMTRRKRGPKSTKYKRPVVSVMLADVFPAMRDAA